MILIVGGAGYIGAHTAKLLAQTGEEVLVYDNLSTGHRDFVKWGPFVEGDLSDKEALEACFNQYDIESVIHFAAFSNVGESVENPEKYYQNNVANTLLLLDVMKAHDVRSIVFSSTAAVYGVSNGDYLIEDAPLMPINPYGRSKLMCEQILKDYSDSFGFHYVSLRYFNAAGADLDSEIGEWHDPETHLIPLAIQTVLGKRSELSIFGTDYQTEDGTCVRDYIHVMDLADAHIKALSYVKEGKSDVFNLGNGRGFSVKEVIASVERVSGKPCPVQLAERRIGDPDRLVSAADKAKTILGWTAQYPELDAIVSSAYRWHNSPL